MARYSFLLYLALTFLVLFHGGQAEVDENQQYWRNECQLEQLNTLEPSRTIQCEAGRIEVWDHHSPQLRCTGVSFFRYVIEPQGLYLPAFYNAPVLSFVVHGIGIWGKVVSGCAETYMDSPEFGTGQYGKGQGMGFRDMHQKVEHLRRGEAFASPPGVAKWIFNNGDEPLIIVSVIDLASHHNQLDRNPRPFYLSGSNPQGLPWMRGRGEQAQRSLISGFSAQFISQSYKVDLKTAEQMQSPRVERGNIVKVRGPFGVIRKPLRRELEEYDEEEYYGPSLRSSPGSGENGLEETFCSMKCSDNLDDPSRADVYKPQLGYISTLNSLNLPILAYLRLSVLRGSIRRKAMVLPHWNINANGVNYVTRGRAYVQIVNDNGDRVFDGEISEGQLLTVPQGYAVAKRAESERFEWITFKTNDLAKINTLAGRTSLVRALPLEVIVNGYGVSLEEARRIKFTTPETTLTHSGESTEPQAAAS